MKFMLQSSPLCVSFIFYGVWRDDFFEYKLSRLCGFKSIQTHSYLWSLNIYVSKPHGHISRTVLMKTNYSKCILVKHCSEHLLCDYITLLFCILHPVPLGRSAAFLCLCVKAPVDLFCHQLWKKLENINMKHTRNIYHFIYNSLTCKILWL